MSDIEKNIDELLQELSDELNYNDKTLAIILAAGHGKRIKSETPKMLHEIWGVPTVLRVSNAARDGLNSANQILVVGIKADEVASSCGETANRAFVYQAEQKGTGHAVRIALDAVTDANYDGAIYVFPGDAGLLNKEVVAEFRQAFDENNCDMMVLTSLFHGPSEENYYGRIVRVPERDAEGVSSGEDAGKVIEIKEHKDILSLSENESYLTKFGNRTYRFSRQELLETREFNTGLYAFSAASLRENINALSVDNVQGELYVTDLIAIFNQRGLSVRAFATQDEDAVLGFNVKSVWKQMDSIARAKAYEQLKDTITVADREDFFIADDVIEDLLKMDREFGPLDIEIGKGVHIGSGVKLARKVSIESNVYVSGNVELSDGVVLQRSVHLSTYPHQKMKIGKNSRIFKNNIIKGDLVIGENCSIESSVNMTGSDEYPIRIGNNVLIKGTSYIFGCVIEDDIWVEHSILKHKYVERTLRKDGTVQPVKWVLPQPQGLDTIRTVAPNVAEDLEDQE